MELNPNHPVTATMSDQWHKIVAILMHKFNLTHCEITLSEIQAMMDSGVGCVTIQEKGDALHLNLISWDEAEKLARREGGLPL